MRRSIQKWDNMLFQIWAVVSKWKKGSFIAEQGVNSKWDIAIKQLLFKIPYFNLISWCRNFLETKNFRRVLSKSLETLQKLCVFTKFSRKKIR